MKTSSIFLSVFLTIFVISCNYNKSSNSPRSIKVSDISKLKIDKKDLIILDVRTPEEISKGKIYNDALELDSYSDNFQIGLERLDKSKTYLVYCKSGGRSSQAIQAMHSLGFMDLYNLEGGFTAWSKSN